MLTLVDVSEERNGMLNGSFAGVQTLGAIDVNGCYLDFHDFGVLCMQEMFEQSGLSQ